MALVSSQDKEKGFIGVPTENIEMVGKTGTSFNYIKTFRKNHWWEDL